MTGAAMMEPMTDDELLAVDDPVPAFKRAIEAVVLVAHDPVEPELLAQLLEQPVASVERWCEELRFKSAQNDTNSLDSRFDLAFSAAHALCV